MLSVWCLVVKGDIIINDHKYGSNGEKLNDTKEENED